MLLSATGLSWSHLWRGRQNLEHAVRTTAAATASLVIARALHLTQPHWAAISTIVVTQSTLGAALTVSGQRFAGTLIGAAAGAGLALLRAGVLSFALGLLGLGLVCPLLRLDRPAYRFAAITLAIILLGSAGQGPWIAAVERCVEVSVGIAVGLAVAKLWPEPEPELKAS